MSRITVRTDAGKIRIRIRDKAPVASKATGAKAATLVDPSTLTKEAVLISSRLIPLMEIRAESSFRPNEEDVEIAYALSGAIPNLPDTLHKLSSGTVVKEATPDYIVSSVQGMIEHIVKERGDRPSLVIEVHTHPRSVPQPSEGDKRYFESAAQMIKTLLPDAIVLFGVHAISSESIREREEAGRISKNTIRWSSITREHEVGFYSPDAKPCEVEILG